ncbi:MAG: hypothetical protein GWN84_20445 [Gammaproteobacteria bacterium]|nr:hypothetical protein [Gammaproteobacteria bacterium]NIR85131.1 hypothetical protein [Gammaproteobacteria bacterium]NIR92060.1 hypothetical protein [Gammaproteobacteria bacterium]NIU06180.1 hypothetical protein [Gammaproteobacteria bacterium]NIV53179.1 hypothetical protein [Gammaproteobacteria bacterium]
MLSFYLWVLLLAALLYYPVNKLIWVLSVRRLQRKLQRELTEEEVRGQLNRARFITVFVVLLFSWLYNFNAIGPPGGG